MTAYVHNGPRIMVTVRTSCPWMVWAAPSGAVPKRDPMNSAFLIYQTTGVTQVGTCLAGGLRDFCA